MIPYKRGLFSSKVIHTILQWNSWFSHKMLLDSYALFYTLYLLVEEIFPAKKTNSLSREIIYCERKFDIIRGNTSLLNKKIICSHKKILV